MQIHLIAGGDYSNSSNWSPILQRCFKQLNLLPYPIKIWNDEEINYELELDDKDFYNDYLSKLPSIYRWDYIRYIILEKYGGVYLDMDIEIIQDFFPFLNNKRMYFMEGTGGAHVENSIMISPHNCDKNWWNRIKMFSKIKITQNFNKCEDKYKVNFYVGSWMLSEFLLKYFTEGFDYEILGYHQFANVKSSISFSKHYHTSDWNR